MIEVEKELNLLDLLFKVLLADQLGAFKQRLHGFLLIEALSFHHGEEVLQLLLSLAEDVGVTDDQGAHSLQLETELVHKEALQVLDSCVCGLVDENELGVVAHDKIHFLLQEPVSRDQLLLGRDYVAVNVKTEECLGHPALFDAGVS